MWTAAWILFGEKPLLGHGPHTFRDISPPVVEEANLFPSIVAERYGHVHNQYLEALYSGGVLGLIGLFVVWGVPAYLFYRRVRRRAGAVSRLALAGLLFIVCFWVYGLTYAPFERKSLVTFYAFSIGLLYGAIRQREREQDRLLIIASAAEP